MAKLYIVMGCRIGGLRLVGGDSGANPGAHYISRSLERFFIRKIPWQVKNKQVLKSLIT
ncbi:Uncharacterised protein [Chlamydia trachomatis]|nr:Uncharacterised protein [Chlamydia trachomatis]